MRPTRHGLGAGPVREGQVRGRADRYGERRGRGFARQIRNTHLQRIREALPDVGKRRPRLRFRDGSLQAVGEACREGQSGLWGRAWRGEGGKRCW
ncbi:hypothetical protein chiPu_0023652, partial [Chiloscyllium punctatum]|nr:hypothetical protein [Chiloscyllium punctatum]